MHMSMHLYTYTTDVVQQLTTSQVALQEEQQLQAVRAILVA